MQMWTTSTSGSRDELLGGVERPLGAELGGRGLARLSGDEAATPTSRRAGEAGRARVDGADEAGACDRRAEGASSAGT